MTGDDDPGVKFSQPRDILPPEDPSGDIAFDRPYMAVVKSDIRSAHDLD